VTESDQYLILHREVDALETRTLDQFSDATGVEAFFNHLHIDPDGWRLQECAEAGLTSLNLLRQEIIKYPASGPLQLVLAVGFHEIPRCTLRFYRHRAGEIWLTDDLEGYETEAILAGHPVGAEVAPIRCVVRGHPDPVLNWALQEKVTAWRFGVFVNSFPMVAVQVGEQPLIADAQGRAADGTWLTTL
jgi:hypothetical protein